MTNYYDDFTEEQKGMLTVLQRIYPQIPMAFYYYSFSICPNKHIIGFFKFFDAWWGYHSTYYLMGDERVPFFEMIDKKYSDYIKAMDIEEYERIERAIIEGKSDAEVEEMIGRFWMIKQTK